MSNTFFETSELLFDFYQCIWHWHFLILLHKMYTMKIYISKAILVVCLACEMLSCSKAAVEDGFDDLCPRCDEFTIISIYSSGFSPDSVIVKPDVTIFWINYDTVPHNVKSLDNSSFNSGDFTTAGFSYEATANGTFKYKCTLHQHGGVIVVKP